MALAQEFEIIGKITHIENQTLYLIESDGRSFYLEDQPVVVMDSCVVKDGQFGFKGSLEHVLNAAIKIKNGRQFSFILEPGTTKVTADGNALWLTKIDNSLENARYDSLRKTFSWALDSANKHADEYSIQLEGKNPQAARRDSLQYVYFLKQWDSLKMENTAHYINAHPSSFVGLNQLNLLAESYGPSRTRELYGLLKPYFSKHPLLHEIHSKITQLENPLAIGSQVPEFTLMDMEGNPVSFSSLSKKMLLIDFWASWCGPCRQAHPGLRKVYAEWRDKGFEILSISLDKSRESWIKAIGTDQMTWTNVLDQRGFSGEVAILFHVTAIPSNFLVDENGRIIATQVTEAILDSIIKKHLGS